MIPPPLTLSAPESNNSDLQSDLAVAFLASTPLIALPHLVMTNNGTCSFKTIACTSGSFTSSKSIPTRCYVSSHHYNLSYMSFSETGRKVTFPNPSYPQHFPIIFSSWSVFMSICHPFIRSNCFLISLTANVSDSIPTENSPDPPPQASSSHKCLLSYHCS